MDIARSLTASELFDGVRPEDLAALVGIAQRLAFAPEQTVYEPDSAGDSMYVIVEGVFVVRVRDEHGDEVDIVRLKPGSYFGEMELIGGMNRTAAVISEGDGVCIRLDAVALLDVLKRSDRLAAFFYRQVSRELVRRLRNTTRDMGYFKARAG